MIVLLNNKLLLNSKINVTYLEVIRIAVLLLLCTVPNSVAFSVLGFS